MSFISVKFLIFFISLSFLHFSLPHKTRWMVLLTAGFIFYGSMDLRFLPVLILPSTLVYFLTLKMSSEENAKRRKFLLYLNLILPLGTLFTFKYFNFFGDLIHWVLSFVKNTGPYSAVKIFFPVGISFFTFKTISYIADVYRKTSKAERHFGYFLLYISFFPQLLAGPIDRASKFIDELKTRSYIDRVRIEGGIRLIIWGIFKKAVIADRLAVFVNNVFQNPSGHHGITLIITAYFYSFQIYCDFSAYSDIAIGLSKILGYRSMKNFNFPYFSKNISDFWKRWHISLSTWLRDYLFLPIAYRVLRNNPGNKRWGFRTETLSYTTGMTLTMLLAGLWHGAGWTFIVWGGLHALFLISGHLTKRGRKKLLRQLGLTSFPRFHRVLKVFITFNMVTFTWIFFRSESLEKALLFIKNIGLGLNGGGVGHILFNTLLIILFIFMEFIIKNRDSLKGKIRIPVLIQSAAYALFICFIIILFVNTSGEFIYFKF